MRDRNDSNQDEKTERAARVSYQLYIRVSRRVRVRVGRLGTFEFPPGRYVYTGSARRGMEARIARHLRRDKKPRWHVDYLLMADAVRIERVVRSTANECDLSRASRGAIVAAGFGSSDCTARCGSHLKRIAGRDGARS